jgi:nitrite reductase/ring-hydroxylating ferredoxin subunit
LTDREKAWFMTIRAIFRAAPSPGAVPPSLPSAQTVWSQMTRLELCRADDVAPGAALRVEKDGLTLAVFNIDGEICVIDDACTHGPGSLSEGYIEGDVVECNFHNGQFNIRTGEVVSPPCMVPVRTYPAVVEDGVVIIEVPAGR